MKPEHTPQTAPVAAFQLSGAVMTIGVGVLVLVLV